MADAWEELHAAFDRGHLDDGAKLSPSERDLYYIQDFILNFEGGGWLYNWTPELERFDRTISAMRRRGLSELAEIVERIRHILTPTADIESRLSKRGETSTWREIQEVVDPNGAIDALEDQIRDLDNYGLPERW